ncbi:MULTISPECIES: hypothetical protein [Alphaproteobacteria]|nr:MULTISPECIES: hypothetical protein [Alphaproteobacteria]
MAYPNSIPTQNSASSEHFLDTPEFIDRRAEELRASSGVDLPHSYFVEQVRLALARHDLTDITAANDVEGNSSKRMSRTGSSVFRAWAMPE